MITVNNYVELVEVDNVEVEKQVLQITSHPLYDNCVVIVTPGHKYVVVAEDLQAAIDNATNTNM